MKRYEFIAKERVNHTVERLCRVMKVSPDAFYKWRAGKSYQLGERKRELAEKVKTVFYFHRRRYGARRIAAQLQAEGVAVGRRQVGSLLRDQNLQAIRPRRFTPRTTDSKHGFGYSENLLKDRNNAPTDKGEVVVGV